MSIVRFCDFCGMSEHDTNFMVEKKARTDKNGLHVCASCIDIMWGALKEFRTSGNPIAAKTTWNFTGNTHSGDEKTY